MKTNLQDLLNELDQLKMELQYRPGTKKRWDRLKVLRKLIAQHPKNQ